MSRECTVWLLSKRPEGGLPWKAESQGAPGGKRRPGRAAARRKGGSRR